jgi:S-adenosylmethionine synthetase
MLFTSEQVSLGHPDKICDQISDALLDAYLVNDKNSRVAIETLIKNNTIIVAGEVTSKTVVDINSVIKNVLSDIGLDNVESYNITNLIDKQSPDIAMGVDIGGAGDQGIIFGYACNETPECMPLAYMLATKALIKLKEINHQELRQDAKAQVTVEYKDGKIRIDTFLISIQHTENITQDEINEVVSKVMIETAKEYGMNTDFKVLVNPTGRFVIGGSFGDCGVTGRKIIADSYGGYAKHGGGAYSGKDYTKVDRSAAYMARYLAKWLLKKYNLLECEIQLGYAIGVAEPVSINITYKDDFNSNSKNGFYNVCFNNEYFENEIRNNFDLTPKGIVDFLDLKNVKYYDTSKYGHFTNQTFNWELIS